MTDIEIMRRAAERITDHNIQLRTFLLRLLDPEDLGYAVTREVREKAQQLLTMERDHREMPRVQPQDINTRNQGT